MLSSPGYSYSFFPRGLFIWFRSTLQRALLSLSFDFVSTSSSCQHSISGLLFTHSMGHLQSIIHPSILWRSSRLFFVLHYNISGQPPCFLQSNPAFWSPPPHLTSLHFTSQRQSCRASPCSCPPRGSTRAARRCTTARAPPLGR